MTATEYLALNTKRGVHAKYISYILNKEFNYSQKDIASAIGTTSSKISAYIKEVDGIVRSRISCNSELETSRELLFKLGYKRLGIDIRSVIYE